MRQPSGQHPAGRTAAIARPQTRATGDISDAGDSLEAEPAQQLSVEGIELVIFVHTIRRHVSFGNSGGAGQYVRSVFFDADLAADNDELVRILVHIYRQRGGWVGGQVLALTVSGPVLKARSLSATTNPV